MRSAALPAVLLLCVMALAGPQAIHAQDLTVSCSISLPDQHALPVEFGLALAAAVGIDPFDEPLPPAAPGQVLQAFLQMPVHESPLPNRWRKEVRPFASGATAQVEIWVMTVECTAVGQQLTFTAELAPGSAPPYALSIVSPDGAEHDVAPGSSLAFPCTSEVMVFQWILRDDEQVASRSATWGGAKTAFLD